MNLSRRRVPLKKSRKTKRSVKKHSVKKRRTAKKGGCDCMMKGGEPVQDQGYVNGPTFTGEPNPPVADESANPNDPSVVVDARLLPQEPEPSVDPSLGISGGKRSRRYKIHRDKIYRHKIYRHKVKRSRKQKGGFNPLEAMMANSGGIMNTNNLVGSEYNGDNSPIA
jgi:hypothetical protein